MPWLCMSTEQTLAQPLRRRHGSKLFMEIVLLRISMSVFDKQWLEMQLIWISRVKKFHSPLNQLECDRQTIGITYWEPQNGSAETGYGTISRELNSGNQVIIQPVMCITLGKRKKNKIKTIRDLLWALQPVRKRRKSKRKDERDGERNLDGITEDGWTMLWYPKTIYVPSSSKGNRKRSVL